MPGRPKISEQSDRIARRVRLLRVARGWSQQELADKMAGHGHPMPRAIIANLETYRRGSVTVDELVALARVFGAEPADWLSGAPVCQTCHDAPPPGFVCMNCGTGGDR